MFTEEIRSKLDAIGILLHVAVSAPVAAIMNQDLIIGCT